MGEEMTPENAAEVVEEMVARGDETRMVGRMSGSGSGFPADMMSHMHGKKVGSMMPEHEFGSMIPEHEFGSMMPEHEFGSMMPEHEFGSMMPGSGSEDKKDKEKKKEEKEKKKEEKEKKKEERKEKKNKKDEEDYFSGSIL